MINLIPPNSKQKLTKEYWVRVVSSWSILWSITLILGATTLLPVYVSIDLQISAYKESSDLAKEKVVNYEEVSVALTEVSKQARVIVSEDALPVFSDFIDLFESLENNDVTINKLILDRERSVMKPIVVQGVAKDRQSLASFRDSILQQDIFEEVDLPISDLAQNSNIQFDITVTLKQNDV